MFVRKFPAFQRIRKGQANGLVHAVTQMTSPDSTNALGGTIITELGTVGYVATGMTRKTYPIAVFATGRGVGIKELAAVRAGGANYDPLALEMENGITKLSTDVQYVLLQGNASNAAGTATTEAGLYNANASDGFRGVIGSQTAFAGNGAVQVDIGGLNIFETIKNVGTQCGNNGGNPTAVFLSYNAKEALDSELSGSKRYTDQTVDIIPGVRANQVPWVNGEMVVIPIPGNTLGTYNRTVDNAVVEDIYCIDESTVWLRWLYSETFTVLEIPAGGDGQLSDRWIVFYLAGVEQAAPLFCGKARRLVA